MSKYEEFQCCKLWEYQHGGFKKFILRDFLLSHQHWLLSEDQLTICYKVSIVGVFLSRPIQNMTPAIKGSRHVLADSLGKLWENSLFTDCCLLVMNSELTRPSNQLTLQFSEPRLNIKWRRA